LFSLSHNPGAVSYQTTATVAPVNTQFISNILAQKINLLDSFLRAKQSFGTVGFSKTISFGGPSTSTTTEKPVTQQTTEVNTDFIPDVSSSTTQTVYTTTTTDGHDIATPKPTVYPQPPITTSTSSPVIPTKRTTTSTSTTSTTSTTAATPIETSTGSNN
ncbi:hypothetical protein KR222_004892, partial [Zaprionus bogoriensis]